MDFLQRLMKKAKQAGMEAAEAYLIEQDSFQVIENCGEIVDYKSNRTRGLSFRGLVKGRMGYASTEAMDEAALEMLVNGVLESAALCEDEDEELLYPGTEEPPTLSLYEPEMERVTPEEKLELVKRLEARMKACDSRVENGYTGLETGKLTLRILNSYGMDRSFTENLCGLFAEPNAREEGFVSSGSYQQFARRFDDLNAEAVAGESVRRAVGGLHAASVPSGQYRVVLHNEVMTSLLSAFSTIFSAETEQKGLSLLKGRLKEKVAADCVTLIDDPLLQQAMGSRPFDAEGVPSQKHTLIDGGVFQTFLHDLKTAKKAGVQTTANAGKAGYASPVRVTPSNLFFQKGELSFSALLQQMGEGLVITEVSGLHAGANPVSGDFSLLAKGYQVENGKRTRPVEQITVAGNFYELLKQIQAFADDLSFPDGATGSASAYAGEMTVSGG